MQTDEQLWNDERELADLDVDVPAWIDQDIRVNQVMAICQGGCASGAYMPAVTYHEAASTMKDHGDEILEYVESMYGVKPTFEDADSWSEMACRCVSMAVELWADCTYQEMGHEA